MKKFGFLIPILVFLGFSMLSTRMYASGTVSPSTMLLVGVVFIAVVMMARPKSKPTKAVSEAEKEILGEFAKDAFSDGSPVSTKFRSALKDYAGNCPKAATKKLTELASQCRSDEETYAVAMATALCDIQQRNYKDAIRQYNKAIVLNPTAELALTLGSCHQRLGELNKARDSYEFALDLAPENLEARSSIATTYVADGDYEKGLEQALMVLDQNSAHASALATAAICCGLLNDSLLQKHYTKLAVENGYNEKKITETISALKKR